MPSVLETLSEAIKIAARNMVLLIALSLLDFIPFFFNTLIPPRIPGTHQPPDVTEAHLGVSAFWLIILAIKAAAILGRLKERESNFQSVFTGIWRYTWTLFRVKVIIVFVSILLLLPLGAVAALLGFLKFGHSMGVQLALALMAIIYAVLVKYALAEPVVIVERLTAKAALEKSWAMTKGHFRFVLACIVAVGLADIIVTQTFKLIPSTGVFGASEILSQLFRSFIGCLSTVIAWCMYGHLRDAENAAAAPTLSPPEWPSGPRSA